MKRLSKDQLRAISGGKFAPPPCSICNDPNETPNSYYLSNYSYCGGGGGLASCNEVSYGTACYLGSNNCVSYTQAYSCPNSGLSPNAGGLCGGVVN